MIGVSASAARADVRLPIVWYPRGEERWASRSEKAQWRLGRSDLAMVAASVCLHVVVLGLAIGGSGAVMPRPASEPIPVEIVRSVPDAKRDAPSQVQPNQDQANPPQPQPAQPVKAQPARTEIEKAPSKPAPLPGDRARAGERHDLEAQLAELKAEQSALKSEQASLKRAPAQAAGALGPLPDSFQAVALPSDAAGQGEAVGYAELVFSQLAKAKGIGRRMGQPGSAGVRFVIDAAGGLVDVDLVATSGIPSLDAEALAVVRKAAPFPAPPPGAQRSFSANVSFVAEGAPP